VVSGEAGSKTMLQEIDTQAVGMDVVAATREKPAASQCAAAL